MQIVPFLADHREAVFLAYILVSILGNVGQILKPKHPAVAAAFFACEKIGADVIGLVRQFAGPVAPPLSQPTLPSVAPPPPSNDERGYVRPEFAVVVMAAGIGVAASIVLGCGAVAPAIEASAYGAKLADCETRSATCAAYVACRDAVQVAEGRGHYRGHCADEDAGALDSGPIDAGLGVGGDQ